MLMRGRSSSLRELVQSSGIEQRVCPAEGGCACVSEGLRAAAHLSFPCEWHLARPLVCPSPQAGKVPEKLLFPLLQSSLRAVSVVMGAVVWRGMSPSASAFLGFLVFSVNLVGESFLPTVFILSGMLESGSLWVSTETLPMPEPSTMPGAHTEFETGNIVAW